MIAERLSRPSESGSCPVRSFLPDHGGVRAARLTASWLAPPSASGCAWVPAALLPARGATQGQGLGQRVCSPHRPSYVVPTSLSHGIKLVNPMFRGYAQQVGWL